MAVNGTPEPLHVHRLPLSKYIDALRWFHLSPPLTASSSSPISSLKVSQTLHKSLIAASAFSSSLHVLFANPVDALIESEVSVPAKTLHIGPILCIDVQENGSECVSVGEDGRVNLVSVGNSNLRHRRFFDSNGLVSYTTAKWASPVEFAVGGLGKPGGAASQFKSNW
ncbi:hypothetical protein CsSME_00008213 [Camellia sinensis var. sinensis]